MPRMTGVLALEEISAPESVIAEPTAPVDVPPPLPPENELGETRPAARRPIWLVPVIAAVVGSLIGGGVVAALTDRGSSTVIRFGNNSSVLAKPADIQGVLAKVEPAVVSVRTEAFQTGGFFLNQVQRVRGAGTGMILTPNG